MAILKQSSSIEHLKTLINDVEKLIVLKEDFIAFIVLALGTEFLGSFIDSHDFNEFGQSEIRFKAGISLFKDTWYKQNSQWLFEQFRGPLIHQYRTGNEILLTSKCKNNAPLTKHLKTGNSKRIFVLEQYFDDFKNAFKKLENSLTKENSPLNKKKFNQHYMALINVDQDVTAASGTTQSTPLQIQKPDVKLK